MRHLARCCGNKLHLFLTVYFFRYHTSMTQTSSLCHLPVLTEIPLLHSKSILNVSAKSCPRHVVQTLMKMYRIKTFLPQQSHFSTAIILSYELWKLIWEWYTEVNILHVKVFKDGHRHLYEHGKAELRKKNAKMRTLQSPTCRCKIISNSHILVIIHPKWPCLGLSAALDVDPSILMMTFNVLIEYQRQK